MAITLITHDRANNIDLESEVFVGRVLRVERTTVTRNWSSTMDYSDYRTTQCTYALVWLGTHDIPPEHTNTARPMAHWSSLRLAHEALPDYLTDRVRDLEYFEQFAWVDCTNLHGDRMSHRLVNPHTDSAPFISGEPLMWVNFIAWEAYMDASNRDRAAKIAAAAEARRIDEEKRVAAETARAAKREATLAATRAVADAEYAAALPFKGKMVSVDGFAGTVFWMGVKAYRGTFHANAGVRNAKGEVQWVRCNQLR